MSQITNRVYSSYGEAITVIHNLEANGVSHNDISIVANNVDKSHDPTHKDATAKGAGGGAAAGGAVGAGAGLLAGLGMLAIPGVGPVVAAGWLIATAAGAAVGASAGAAAGGIIGKLTEYEVSKGDAELYMETIRRGGALVSVKTSNDNKADVERIMDKTTILDMNARASTYREEKWMGFDPSATPYTPAQIVEERGRYL